MQRAKSSAQRIWSLHARFNAFKAKCVSGEKGLLLPLFLPLYQIKKEHMHVWETSSVSPPEEQVGSTSFESCASGNCCSDLQQCAFSVWLWDWRRPYIFYSLLVMYFVNSWETEVIPFLWWRLAANFFKTACQAVISLISAPVWK